ncbi:hypothetical protein DD235_02370 [Corticimicrobacter populi]|uniref:Uncharacterized protein n=1 Tax=Corticimicrobacter populi TaxID=2175229 RepID=A0A2V1K187_9BURK|nr:hypothetical protein DD235_02370 [Corticimicrobacter populi]
METKTERLLREAHRLCQDITDRRDVSDDLLHAVFERLCIEQEGVELLDNIEMGTYSTLH